MFDLSCHPTSAPASVRSVKCSVTIQAGLWMRLRWAVEGGTKLILPEFTGRKRADDLWKSTCFELFVKPHGADNYSEFNFSPSQSWAAYDFTGWREGMCDRPLSHDPVITPQPGGGDLLFDVAIPIADLPELPADFSVTAILEEEGGQLSYWAMAHGRPDKPDFHDAACFAATLGPPIAS